MAHIITIPQALAASGLDEDGDNVRAVNMALTLASSEFSRVTRLSLDKVVDAVDYFLIDDPINDVDSFGYVNLILSNGFVSATAGVNIQVGGSKAAANENDLLDVDTYEVDLEQGLVSLDVTSLVSYGMYAYRRPHWEDRFVVKVEYTSGFDKSTYDIEPGLRPSVYTDLPQWVQDAAIVMVSEQTKACGKGVKKQPLEEVLWPMVERHVRYHPAYMAPKLI